MLFNAGKNELSLATAIYVLLKNSNHMKMTLSQKILAGFIACTIVLAAVAIFSFRNSEKFIDTNQWVNHTYEVLNELDQLLTATVDAETGVRGYVISGNEVFLEPYNNALQISRNILIN